MLHFVYETTNLVNGKFYRGSHITDKVEDGYLGSGTGITRAIKKYGRANFQRRVLAYCKSEKGLESLEAGFVTEAEVRNPRCYNNIPGGRRPPLHKGDTHPVKRPDVRAKLSAAATGRKHTPETLAKMSAAKLGKPGVPRSEACKAKISAANKGKQPFLGRTHSPEVRAAMSARMTGRTVTTETRAKLRAIFTGRPNPNRVGKLHSAEAKARMSAAQKARYANA